MPTVLEISRLGRKGQTSDSEQAQIIEAVTFSVGVTLLM